MDTEMHFEAKAGALQKLNESTPLLVCRDSTRLLPCGKYSGGKVFCACAGAHALAAHAGRLRRHGRHLYEHVGHDVEHPLAPYLDVELLLTLDNDEKAYAPLIRCYVDAVAEILRPHVALDPGENMRIGTAIARVPVHRNAQGALRKGAPSSPSSQGAGQALLLSFHLKVHAPGAYFLGNARQAHFWRAHAGALAARVAPRCGRTWPTRRRFGKATTILGRDGSIIWCTMNARGGCCTTPRSRILRVFWCRGRRAGITAIHGMLLS